MPYRYLAYISPTTYAAQIAQYEGGYIQLAPSMIAISWAVLVTVTAVLFLIAASKARWREK
jgi:ABC-2 type transport system permease protein